MARTPAQAVQNGGGLSLLAAALSYVRPAEPVRFRHRWEQYASLRLATATPPCWPAMTSTAGSSASRSR